jgi:Flp pilus assembly protein TadG
MLTLFFGGVELSQGIGIDRKVTLTARTVADLVAQVPNTDVAGVNSALNAAGAVLAPYPVSNATVTVSVVKIDANSQASVEWSRSKNGTAHAPGDAVTLPPALIVPNTYLIWGEVSYAYTPAVGYVVTGTRNLNDKIFMRPRLSDVGVPCPNNCK